MKSLKKPAAIALLLTICLSPSVAQAATSPSLGTASTYSILAGSAVTNTGATTISGDVGISPGIGAPPHYSGFGTVTLGGTIHDADGAALLAQADKTAAYANLASQPCTTDYGVITQELAGLTLVPGVYCANEFDLSNGTLTLNGAAADICRAPAPLKDSTAAAVAAIMGGGEEVNVGDTPT